MRHARVGTTVLVLLALVSATPAVAQTTIGFEIAGFSKYMWRGLSLTNKPVIQPDLWLSIPVGSASLTVGGWANIEPLMYDGDNAISQGGGAAGPDVTEFDWWADITKTLGVAIITAGATGYLYPNDFGLTSDAKTIELYGKLVLAVPVLSPRLSVYYDIDKIKGFYLEGGVSQSFSLTPAFAMTFGALAGWSAGQGVDSDPSANFAGSGLTHVDLSASTDFDLGPVSIAPQLHFAFNRDEFTRFIAPGHPNRAHNIWFGAVISWSNLFEVAPE